MMNNNQKKKKKKIIKNVRPVGIDAHFKYQCPKCKLDYWISYQEAKTSGFKIVCDCGIIFSPKVIAKIVIKHSIRINKTDQKQKETEADDASNATSRDLPVDILDKCCKILSGYGFTESESKEMIIKAHEDTDEQDSVLLIKHCLKSLGATIDG